MTSIIIVNWNGGKFLEDCFNSLRSQTCKDFEIVFVDNASTDNSLDIAKRLSPTYNLTLKFIELDRNTGFAKGNNEGLKYSSGQYVALLNTDTIADKDWLKNLVETMDANSGAGICASKLIVLGENVIDSAGDGYSTFGHAFKRGEGSLPQNFSEQEYVFGACAGAAIYRRKMIDEIGLFDEDFFLIFEDTDLNFRAQLNGWKCLYMPDAVVYHKVGGSMRNLSSMIAYYSVRNDKLVKIKNLPLTILFSKMLCFIVGEVITCAYWIMKGRFKDYLKANIDVLKSLPIYIKKRRDVMKLKRVPNIYISSLFTSGFRLYGFKRIRRYFVL